MLDTHIHADHITGAGALRLKTGAAVGGSLLGSRFAEDVPAQTLRKGFAVFVAFMAAFVTYQEAGVLAGVLTGAAAGSWIAVQAYLQMRSSRVAVKEHSRL